MRTYLTQSETGHEFTGVFHVLMFHEQHYSHIHARRRRTFIIEHFYRIAPYHFARFQISSFITRGLNKNKNLNKEGIIYRRPNERPLMWFFNKKKYTAQPNEDHVSSRFRTVIVRWEKKNIFFYLLTGESVRQINCRYLEDESRILSSFFFLCYGYTKNGILNSDGYIAWRYRSLLWLLIKL